MLKGESKESSTWARPCDTCESAPATFFCKADAASLCTSCDDKIHSANPLARRHQRVPILDPLSANSCTSMAPKETDADNDEDDDEDDLEVASWLLPNPGQNTGTNQNNGFLFGVEYLDLVDYNSTMDSQFEDHSQYQRSFGGGDGVVPLQVEESTQSLLQQSQQNLACSSRAHYNNSLMDLNYSASVSSMDISVVPETTESDITVQQPRTTKETIDQQFVPPTQIVQQLTPMEREARVLRYREKKKTRKFNKTIRYASRKAYAEIRPRIKGRFAKRIQTEAEAEDIFTTSLMSETGYGIVPSF